jgi:hypothetical protein
MTAVVDGGISTVVVGTDMLTSLVPRVLFPLGF